MDSLNTPRPDAYATSLLPSKNQKRLMNRPISLAFCHVVPPSVVRLLSLDPFEATAVLARVAPQVDLAAP